MTGAESKVTPAHLARKAVVYVRQSSTRQVQENVQSQRLQYALRDRAMGFGFTQVEVVDDDLGTSAGFGAKPRAGFTQLLGSVALAEVGMILSIDASRLARTDKDWCQLLELCQAFGTLIADADHIYDVSAMDDQLVLGIKGTLSVVELRVLKNRMQRGREEKARRGELFGIVAPGYCADKEGGIAKDPDARIQAAVQLVFTKFQDCRSARQTHKWFIENQVSLPVNRYGNGQKRIEWQAPALGLIRDMLRNPVYAGAYVYGRKRIQMRVSEGRLIKRTGPELPPEECRVFIREHHEGYISWEQYEENRRKLRSNALRLGSDESVAAVRQGHGLLSGLLRCGRCGKKMHVRYWGKSGTSARYVCVGNFEDGGGYCIGFGGATVDRRFSELLLEVISPLGIEASLKAIESINTEADAKSAVFEKQLQQLEYESQRAFEQYNAVDARNRLAAAELERRWNEKLEELDRARTIATEARTKRQTLTEVQKQELLQMGRQFSGVWNSPACSMESKKRIIRTVIEEILVQLDERASMLEFIIHWKGGAHTGFQMQRPRSGAGRTTEIADVELIRKMASRYSDGEIARVLNKLNRRTGKGLSWSQSRIADVRRKNGIAAAPARDTNDSVLSLAQAAAYCGVSDTTIRKLVDSQALPMSQAAPWAPWEIQRDDLDRKPVSLILAHLRKTGKLIVGGIVSTDQPALFQENQ